MKVVFNSRDAVNLSAIESVDVSEANGNVKIVVRYQTRGEVNLNCINFRRPMSYHPCREMTRELAEEITEEIESLTRHPDLSIRRVIDLKAWHIGCLGVDLNTATEVQATRALARLCLDWSVGSRNAPSDRALEQRTGLDTDTIDRITARGDYKRCVEDLLLNGSLFEPRTPEEFGAWVAEYADMPTRFGKRMRLCEDDVETLVKSVASQHGIVLSGFCR